MCFGCEQKKFCTFEILEKVAYTNRKFSYSYWVGRKTFFRRRFLDQFWSVSDDPALFRKVFTHSIMCCNAFCVWLGDAKVSGEKQLIRRGTDELFASLAITTMPITPKLLRYTPGTCIPNVSKFEQKRSKTGEVHFLPSHQYPSWWSVPLLMRLSLRSRDPLGHFARHFCAEFPVHARRLY
jgi:hypothetical protein